MSKIFILIIGITSILFFFSLKEDRQFPCTWETINGAHLMPGYPDTLYFLLDGTFFIQNGYIFSPKSAYNKITQDSAISAISDLEGIETSLNRDRLLRNSTAFYSITDSRNDIAFLVCLQSDQTLTMHHYQSILRGKLTTFKPIYTSLWGVE